MATLAQAVALAVVARLSAINGAGMFVSDLSADGQVFRGPDPHPDAPLPAVGVTLYNDSESFATFSQGDLTLFLRLFCYLDTTDLPNTLADPTGYGEMEDRISQLKDDVRRTLETNLLRTALSAQLAGLGSGVKVRYKDSPRVGDADNAPVGQYQMDLEITVRVDRSTQAPGA